MDKRTEIREGMAGRIYEWHFRNSGLHAWEEWGKVSGATRGMVLALTDIVLEYLHSQGVVIKVKRELPVYLACFDNGIVSLEDDILDNAGYVPVIPIKKGL